MQRDGATWILKTVDPTPRADGGWDVETIAALPDSAEHIAWKSADELYTAAGSRIYHLRLPGHSWETVADLSRAGVKHITRLALHPNGRELAIVAAPRLSGLLTDLRGHHQVEDFHYFPVFRRLAPQLTSGMSLASRTSRSSLLA